MLYTFIINIIINIIIIIIGIVGAIIVAITSLRGLIEDIVIIKRGNKYDGECIDGRFHGREYYLIVQWTQDGVQHEDSFLAVSRKKKYPYKVDVYSYNYKTNLGVKSLLYHLIEVVYFLSILIALVVFIIYR